MLDLPPPTHLYIGTYTKTTSQGIYVLDFDPATGALGEPRLVAAINSPTWLAFTPDRRTLLAVDSKTEGGAVASFAVDPASRHLRPLSVQATGGGGPCHLIADPSGRMVVAASYGSAVVSSFPLHADGSLGPRAAFAQQTGSGPNASRQEKAHAHGTTLSPDGRFVFVPDLGTDQIFTYALDPANAIFTAHDPAYVRLAPGAGPRHIEFSPDGRHAYVINELDGTITAFSYNAAAGALTPSQTLTTLPPEFTAFNKTAEIIVHPNGSFVYGSNRGHDSIVAYTRDPATGTLTFLEHTPSGGKSPRHFALSADGTWLITAHEESDDLHVFRVDPANGRLTKTPHTATVPMPVCVLFAP